MTKSNQESADRYRAQLEALGLNQSSGARFLQIDGRTSRRFADGEYEVPPITAMLLAIMVKHGITPAQARKLAKLEAFDE